MGRLADTAGVPGHSEDGWTLIELLVALTIGMVVLAGAVTVFIGAVRSEPRTSSKVSAVQEGRIAVERMTRELRQGIEVLDEPAPTAAQIALLTYVKQATCGGLPSDTAIPCQVTYECEADEKSTDACCAGLSHMLVSPYGEKGPKPYLFGAVIIPLTWITVTAWLKFFIRFPTM